MIIWLHYYPVCVCVCRSHVVVLYVSFPIKLYRVQKCVGVCLYNMYR